MMELRYISRSKLGSIVGGMQRESARATLASAYTEFRKTEFAVATTDAFDNLGLHIYYDASEKVKGVEVFAPSGQVIYEDIRLLGSGWHQLVEALSIAGIAVDEDSMGLTLEDGRIGLYVPDKEQSELAPVTAAYVKLES